MNRAAAESNRHAASQASTVTIDAYNAELLFGGLYRRSREQTSLDAILDDWRERLQARQ